MATLTSAKQTSTKLKSNWNVVTHTTKMVTSHLFPVRHVFFLNQTKHRKRSTNYRRQMSLAASEMPLWPHQRPLKSMFFSFRAMRVTSVVQYVGIMQFAYHMWPRKIRLPVMLTAYAPAFAGVRGNVLILSGRVLKVPTSLNTLSFCNKAIS